MALLQACDRLASTNLAFFTQGPGVYALIMVVVVRRRWFAATAKHGRAFPLAVAGKLLYLERHL
ncbi:hypothetical protein [Sinorhizobium meliloti]|uniref:hypothetical protein n=1 Tax=Rhizobium meliloti TaxID=382 RepID=UPI00059AE1A6|nr:hypothetical protein [Sinorhizobium meliloti]MDE3799998.1 hypothetical protein [Sinorhizobium meliloti]QPI28249.1 hypothetical protein I0J99_18975 [Sinorhizobium meliloti]WQP03425.1 hypothetical protein U8C39_01530 [Sinorhizobium meliloti]WQP09765.1 hypothetical protein U8C30_04955 [Sinorhizobium meliloti]WQP16130.1 hypothetical protein U8C33_05550 [Sinorhizobium meliloti]